MNLTWTEIAEAEGLAKGRLEGEMEGKLEGQQELLLAMLRLRFGEPQPAVASAVARLTDRQIVELLPRLLTANSLAELGFPAH